LNNLLLINKKLILLIFVIISLIVIIFLSLVQNPFNKNQLNETKKEYSFDIINPNFTINGRDEEISIRAKGASFINTNEILLEENVIFKSDTFTLKSPEVFFNQKNQTAYSEKNTTFISEGTKINAKGFEITDEGDKINFKGKTKVTLIK
tara:strand:+ start:13 stop:462 length:450 start_codon:yes stop_codon:yes gene_type:complete